MITPASCRSSLPLAAALLTLAGGTTAAVHAQDKPATATAAAPATAASAADLKAKLPTDPALVVGTLPNGLSYILRKHGNPEGRVSVWLHVSAGSLNESEKTRGIAHYLEHMAFNGSKNFPPGSVVDFFQSLGLQFGRDQNAFTSFDQTTYQLALPDTKVETIDKALLFFSDVGGRLLLRNDEIEMERGIILEEKRTRASAQQRIQDYVFERLAPESTFGRRLPIGTDETIKTVQRPDFEAFYNTFYVPSNMTLIVVGDVDPAVVIPRITAAFGDLKTTPRPADLPVGVQAPAAPRAIVATDPEQTQAEISINRIGPSRGATITVGDMRRDLVELIGTWAFNRRIAAEQAKRKTPYLSASASAQDLANAINFATISATGEPGKWKEMLAEAGVELQRARVHGFTEREIADARNALISQAEEGVQREATLPARAMLGRINGAVAAEEAPMSAGQRLDLYRALLPGITPAEVSAAFAENFDPANALFIAELPASGDAPTEAQLLALGQAAVNVRPDKVAEEARAASLMDKAPTPGTLVEGAVHDATGVLSGWFSNNVRFHHRQMDVRKNEASIIITLAGGEIQETAATRGLSSAASLAWLRPATSTLSSTQIRDLMTGKKVSVRGGAGADNMVLTISGNPQELETGMQLAHLLLTDPKIEPAAFEQWKLAQMQGIKARRSTPEGIMAESVAAAILPAAEVRSKPLTEEQINAVKLTEAQAWLRQVLATSPIEVAVVGDIARQDAERLVGTYVASLPKRERISDRTYQDIRKIDRTPGPIVVDKSMATKTDKAVVMDGFFGADIQNVRDVRLLQLASRVLSTRLIKVIREEKQLVYSIGASSRPAAEYPGLGMFMAQAPTDPAKASALPAALEEVYSAFAQNGPTDDELSVATLQLIKSLEETMREPDFWTARLASLTYRGLKLDDVVTAVDFYKAVKPAEVKETFAKYYIPANRFRFVVRPEAAAPAAAEPAPSK